MKNRKQYLKVVIIGLSLVMVIFILRNLFIGRNSTEGLIPNYYSGEEIQEFIDTSDRELYIPSLEGWKIEGIFEVEGGNESQYNLEVKFVNGEDELIYRCNKLKVSEKEFIDAVSQNEIITYEENEVVIPIDTIELDNTTVYYVDLEKYSKQLKENFDKYEILEFTVYTWMIEGFIYSIDKTRYNIKHSQVIDIIESFREM